MKKNFYQSNTFLIVATVVSVCIVILSTIPPRAEPTPSNPIPSEINQENYPDVVFLEEEITLEKTTPPANWLSYSNNYISINYPPSLKTDKTTSTIETAGVSFCPVANCETFEFIVSNRLIVPKEFLFFSLAQCETSDIECQGKKLAVSQITINDHPAQIWWFEKLSAEEAATASAQLPQIGNVGTIVIEHDDAVFQIKADLSNEIHKQMLGTLKFQ